MASAYGGEAILNVTDVTTTLSGVGDGNTVIYACPASRYAKIFIYFSSVTVNVASTSAFGNAICDIRIPYGSYTQVFLRATRALNLGGTTNASYDPVANTTELMREYILLPAQEIQAVRSQDGGAVVNYDVTFYAKIFEYAKP